MHPTSADILGLPRSRSYLGTLVGLTCLAVLTALGLWFLDRANDRKADRQLVAQVQSITQRIDNEEQWLRQAIYDRRAIRGMTRTEVLMAKGEPRTRFKGDEVPEVARQRGAVEAWIYPFRDTDETATVLFGHDGQVVWSRDSAGLPPEGNAIRQR